jgi:hypothetical protein
MIFVGIWQRFADKLGSTKSYPITGQSSFICLSTFSRHKKRGQRDRKRLVELEKEHLKGNN